MKDPGFAEQKRFGMVQKTVLVSEKLVFQWAGKLFLAQILQNRLQASGTLKDLGHLDSILRGFVSDIGGSEDISFSVFFVADEKMYRQQYNCEVVELDAGALIVGGSGSYKFLHEESWGDDIKGKILGKETPNDPIDDFIERCTYCIISERADSTHYYHGFGASFEFAVGNQLTGFRKIPWADFHANLRLANLQLETQRQLSLYRNDLLIVDNNDVRNGAERRSVFAVGTPNSVDNLNRKVLSEFLNSYHTFPEAIHVVAPEAGDSESKSSIFTIVEPGELEIWQGPNRMNLWISDGLLLKLRQSFGYPAHAERILH